MVAALHLERIPSAPVGASHTGATPARWIALTHGMFGAGTNWRGIARKVHAQRPDWGVLLVDLRQHGRSEPGEPPHTVAACAEDVRAALAATGLPIRAIAGHSFGGKVMLAARALVRPLQTWILDASPSARTDELGALAVLSLMERLPRVWPSRDAFVRAIVDGGFSLVLANWLAMNVVSDDAGGYVSRLDLAAMRAMIADYCRVDLWPQLLAREPGEVEVMIATKSHTVSERDRARLAAAPTHVHVHFVDADHWLHLEAAATVVDLLVSRLP